MLFAQLVFFLILVAVLRRRLWGCKTPYHFDLVAHTSVCLCFDSYMFDVSLKGSDNEEEFNDYDLKISI